MRLSLCFCLALLAAAACAPGAAIPSPAPARSGPSSAGPSASAPPPHVSAAAPDASNPNEPRPASPPAITLAFERQLEAEVLALAVEKAPHVAALGPERLWISDANGWRSEPLPGALLEAPRPDLSIFFGRDYRVRVIGTRITGSKAQGLYFRWLPAGLKRESAELGRLGTPPGALVAVLGTEDPEIVCRPGEICLIKSRRGWQTIDAPASIELVGVGGGVGFAVAGRQVLRLGPSGWERFGNEGDWAHADALFATADAAWIVETAAGRIHRLDASRSSSLPSPIAGPRALWGVAESSLWLAGDAGLAHFDGKTWRVVKDAPAPLTVVRGRPGGELWVGGPGGLFSVKRAP